MDYILLHDGHKIYAACDVADIGKFRLDCEMWISTTEDLRMRRIDTAVRKEHSRSVT